MTTEKPTKLFCTRSGRLASTAGPIRPITAGEYIENVSPGLFDTARAQGCLTAEEVQLVIKTHRKKPGPKPDKEKQVLKKQALKEGSESADDENRDDEDPSGNENPSE